MSVEGSSQTNEGWEAAQALLSGSTRRNEDSPKKPMHGFNTAGADVEPLDQVGSMVAAGLMQEQDQDANSNGEPFVPFIAAAFGGFNQEGYDETIEYFEESGEEAAEKQRLFEGIAEGLNIDIEPVTTEKVFSDQRFWEIFAETVQDTYPSFVSLKRDTETIMSQDYISGKVEAEEAIDAVEDYFDVSIPEAALQSIQDFERDTGEEMRAPHMYITAEIAVSTWLEEKHGVNHKLGPATEKIYDKKIAGFHDTTRMKQPVETHSQQDSPATANPYIAWDPTANRLFADDEKAEIEEKVQKAPTGYVAAKKHPHNGVEGEVLNPVVEKGLYAVEGLRMAGETVEIDGREIESGGELLEYVTEGSYDSGNLLDAEADQEAMETVKDELPEMYEKLEEEISYRGDQDG